MITEQDYQILAEQAYNVDSKKQEKPRKEGDVITNNQLNNKFEVLKVEDNKDNGMQAMAVAL